MPSPPIPFIDETVADLQKIHGFVGTILGFTIGQSVCRPVIHAMHAIHPPASAFLLAHLCEA
jgi:hypothetical protein